MRAVPGTYVDVSVNLTEHLPTWTGSPGISRAALLSRARGDDANATQVTMDVHTGTHIDAPRHFTDDGLTLEHIELARLLGPTYVASVPVAGSIEPADLDLAGIPDGTARLLLRTANSEIADLYTTPFREDYAALSPAAAQWVVDRGIDVIGIDYLSIQRFNDPPDAHVIILGAGLVIVEGLDLSHISEGWHDMICMPILLTGAEAAPARVALRPQSES